MISKICRACQVEKPIDDFSIVRANKDGHHSRCKICYAAKMREWQSANREKVNAQALRYHYANREKANLKRKENYEKNKEAHLANSKKWAENNREITRVIKANSTHKRRQKIRNQEPFRVNSSELNRMLRNGCFYCGASGQISIDHVIPISRGGLHKIGNLVPACRSCNSSKSSKFIMEWRVRNAKVTSSN